MTMPSPARSEATRSHTEAKHLSVRTLATISIVGTVAFAVMIFALHFLKSSVDPVQRPTSEYAVGPFAYLMTAAFLSLSASTWALVVGLSRALPRQAKSRLGLSLLGVWGIGLLVAATFPIDLEGAGTTSAGRIHAINGPLTFLALVLGVNLVSLRLRRVNAWAPDGKRATRLALFMVAGFIAGGLTAANGAGAGIAQRVLLIALVTWFLLIAFGLRSTRAT